MQKSRELDADNSFSITEICSDTFCLVVSLLKVQREKRWQRLKGGHFQVKDVHSLSGIKKSQSWESYRLVSNTDNTLLLGCAQFVSWENHSVLLCTSFLLSKVCMRPLMSCLWLFVLLPFLLTAASEKTLSLTHRPHSRTWAFHQGAILVNTGRLRARPKSWERENWGLKWHPGRPRIK